MAGSGLSLIHLCISYSYQHNASHKIHPQLVFVEWILFVCIVCFPLGPSIYFYLQPWLLSLKLLTYRSICMRVSHMLSELHELGELMNGICLPHHPPHLLCSLPLLGEDHQHHPLSSLSLLIRSSTKLCSFDFPKVSRIPLFFASPPPLLIQVPHHLSPDCCRSFLPIRAAFWLHPLKTPLSLSPGCS